MLDPCKGKKCISYPICLTRNRIKCKLLAKHLEEYMSEEFGMDFATISPGEFTLKYDRSAKLWNYINSFLIHLNEVTVSLSWGNSGLYLIDIVLQQTKNSSYRCLNVVQSTPKVLKKKAYNQAFFPDKVPTGYYDLPKEYNP
jgi:hypothetical protein